MSKITVYSTPTCPYCNMVKEYLKNNQVEFEDINVAADPQAARTMIEKSGQMGVPVTVIPQTDTDEKILIGYDEPALKELISKLPKSQNSNE